MKRNNIENLFLPEELSSEIIKLGFNEVCFTSFYKGEFKITPTYQQVFDWFEEEFGIYCSIDNILLDFSLAELTKEGEIKILKPVVHKLTYKSKQEVREYCIKNIIEIIKTK